MFRRLLFLLPLALLLSLPSHSHAADPTYVGAENCQKCHEAEYHVWEETRHFKSFKEIHKSPKAKEVLAAVGGPTSMKKHPTCTLCHYTMVPDETGAGLVARSGPSCERCHGPASEWIGFHNDYGGATITREQEDPAHKATRIADGQKAGMRWPFMKYDLASNCMNCHALTQPKLEADTLAKMLDAGHPFKPEWEFIRYSQGSVRHRFYPPDITINREMTPQELSRNFVIGAAAKLVSATNALKKSTHPRYQEGQKQRRDDAIHILSAVKSVPEAAQLMASPTDENARKLVAAIQDKDLSGEVGSLLPDPSTYK